MYNKIGFLTGIGGNSEGLGSYINYCEATGVPAIIASNDNVNGIYDIIKLNSSIEHKMLYRVVRDRSEKYAVPRYDLPQIQAAEIYYDLVEPLIHPFVKEHKDKIWIALGNELDKERCNWLGGWGIESAKIWNANGYKVAMFGFASGTPEPNAWKEAGMLAFLRFAGANKDKVAINLHEYSYNDNLLHIFPWLIGRFQFLFQVCDENQIPRPILWIGEWGWHQDKVPDTGAGMPQLVDVSNLYAQFKTIEGAAFWTLQNWHTPIYNQVNTYIRPVTIHSTHYNYVDFSLQDKIFVTPDANKEEGMRVIACDVSRHNNKKDANGNPSQPIDFNKMHSQGAEACYVRGSIGGVVVDDAFAMNWTAIKGTPLDYGMYHYFNTRYTAQENLENIISVVEAYGHGKLRIALDIEPFKVNNQYVRINGDRVTELVRLFQDHFRYDPVIYTAKWVLSYVDGDTSWLNSNYLWIANYWSRPPREGEYPTMPPGTSASQLVMHQWTSSYYDGRQWGVASTGLDINVVYDLNKILITYLPPDSNNKPTTVVALLPQEYTDEDWGAIAPHAQRDNKRDLTASHYSAEAIYLAGDNQSYIKIIDREYPSQERAVEYFRSKDYRLEYVTFRPPTNNGGNGGNGENVDIHSFLVADARAWRVIKHEHPSGHQSQEDVQDMILGNGVFVRRKNNLGEWWTIDGKLIHDTSPAPAETGPEAGISRVYTLYKDGKPGAPKFPKLMKLGDSWTEEGFHSVRFRAKHNCQNLVTNSGDNVQNTCKFVKHEKGWTFNKYGQNITIDEVIWLNTGAETQIYGKQGGVPIGWIGWEAPWGKSEIVELHWDRGVLTKEPHKYCAF